MFEMYDVKEFDVSGNVILIDADEIDVNQYKDVNTGLNEYLNLLMSTEGEEDE